MSPEERRRERRKGEKEGEKDREKGESKGQARSRAYCTDESVLLCSVIWSASQMYVELSLSSRAEVSLEQRGR